MANHPNRSRFNDRMVKMLLQGAVGDLTFTPQGHIAHKATPNELLVLIYPTGTTYPAITEAGLEFIREHLYRGVRDADKAVLYPR